MEARSKLEQAFVDALGISQDTDFDTLEYRSIDEWDSVSHMLAVMEIEAQFDVMLETEEVLNMSSFIKAQEILARHGVHFNDTSSA